MRRFVLASIAVCFVLTPAVASASGPRSPSPAPAVAITVSHSLLAGDPIDLELRPGSACGFPIREVTATLWNGFRIDLGLVPGEPGWFAEVETPGDLSPGRYPIRIVAGDGAGHRQRWTVYVSVRAPRLARAAG